MKFNINEINSDKVPIISVQSKTLTIGEDTLDFDVPFGATVIREDTDNVNFLKAEVDDLGNITKVLW